MSDAPTSTDPSETTTAPEPDPVVAAPTAPSNSARAQRSPIDQVKDAANRVLGLITGRK